MTGKLWPRYYYYFDNVWIMVSILFFALTVAASTAVPRHDQSYKTVRKGNIDEQGPYLEGDMVLNEEQLMNTKSGIRDEKYRWPNNRLPYMMDSTFSPAERNISMEAMLEIQAKTCITFSPLTRDDKDYINITRGGPGTGCWSRVGRQGGGQQMNLQAGNPGCIHKGTIIHELIHCIGFFHEQSRTDRDSYVLIENQNIQTGMQHNFEKYTSQQVDPFKTGYDYYSIMHYSAYAFSKNGNATIVPTKRDVRLESLGQRNGLSRYDAQKINTMYNCKAIS